MQLVTSFFISVVIGYLSITNSFADRLLSLFNISETENINNEFENTMIGSKIEREISFIPDALLRNKEFQRATALTSIETSTYTSNATEALVNIYCQSTTNRSIRTTTGTGFFIHDKGIILTNAHVAQYLLLQNTEFFGKTTCSIRTGSPATLSYEAELLYIPPSWIFAHATNLIQESPTGTGERDYALLYITKSLTGNPLPSTFPALQLSSIALLPEAKNQRVQVSGYPAESMLSSRNLDNITPQTAWSSISEIYTFGTRQADVIGVRGTFIGEQGSSGGPVLNTQNSVIGVISTRGDDTIDGKGSLRAITTAHIDTTILEESGFSLARMVSGDVANRARIFSTTIAPLLTQILVLQSSF
jgi:hypothetical protein